MTVAVFLGFGYLLWNDIQTNLNDKLYTFTVRDKFLSTEECSNFDVNFQTFRQSFNLIFGIVPDLPPEEIDAFDPLDNDYIQFILYQRDLSDEAREKLRVTKKPALLYTNADFDIERCSPQAYNDLITPSIRFQFPKGLCIKHRDKVGFRGNYGLESNANIYLGIAACDPERRLTCKSREDIGKFLSKSTLYVVN